MVTETVLKMKEGKACGSSGIVIEMVKAGGDAMLDVITNLINLIIKEEKIPENWDQSTIMELWWSLKVLPKKAHLCAWKNVFYFISKALFVLEIIKF